MRKLMMIAALILTAQAVRAAEPGAEPGPPAPAAPDKVNPAKYRILVEYDEATQARIRAEIRAEVERALDERLRRLRMSRDVAIAEGREALRRYQEEMDALRRARGAGEEATRRGDVAEADKWNRLAEERLRAALDLAERTRRVEEALLAISLQDWRNAKEKEEAVAAKALAHLQAYLAEIRAKEEAERRERGPELPPPGK